VYFYIYKYIVIYIYLHIQVYYTHKDAILVLWKALKDDVTEIRRTASETLLVLAAQVCGDGDL